MRESILFHLTLSHFTPPFPTLAQLLLIHSTPPLFLLIPLFYPTSPTSNSPSLLPALTGQGIRSWWPQDPRVPLGLPVHPWHGPHHWSYCNDQCCMLEPTGQGHISHLLQWLVSGMRGRGDLGWKQVKYMGAVFQHLRVIWHEICTSYFMCRLKPSVMFDREGDPPRFD